MAHTLTSEKNLLAHIKEVEKQLSLLRLLRAAEWGGAVLFLAVGLVYRFVFDGSWLLAGLGALCLFFALGHAGRIAEAEAEAADLSRRRDAKQRVAALLDEKLANDHYVLNDIHLKVGREKCWIDHVVVAPSGIFVVSTLPWSGKVIGDTARRAHHWKIKDPDGSVRPARNPVSNVIRQRRILCNWLKGTDLIWENVRTIVVLADPTVEIDVLNAKDLVCTPDRAVGYINDFCFNTPVLSTPEVESLAKGLNDRTAV